MTSRPVASALLLCDYLIVEENTKKVSLIGTFTKIAAPAAGDYQFTLLVNGEWVAQRRITAHERGNEP